jgi:hypothetical protein
MYWLIVAASLGADPNAELLFTEKVRPILAAHCFKCHGPDDRTRKANLRLDRRDNAQRVLGVPGDSELLRRIESTDPDVQMPPPHAKIPLSSEQKAILAQWIRQGAPYREHWAFLPPKRPPVPVLTHRDWEVRNPIDAFILARLAKEGIQPAPPADRATLVRRVYLDLIGLPPTPEEADEFLNDLRPDAYERLVDRLLASPRYGERWARRWLDLARYADTNGYEKDRPRSIWPYRDWVIRALNDDLPFDQFTIEQIAGDMLPGASESQRIATGFHRNTMLNEEGGIDPLEFRYYAMVDRVNTTGTVWLGLTLGCAQCHTHKFDPIPIRDYYRLMALLNNADEPTMDVQVPEIAAQRQRIQTQIDQYLADLPHRLPPKELEALFADWLKTERQRTVPWSVLRPVEATSNLPILEVQPDDSVFVLGDQSKSDQYRLRFQGAAAGITAIRLEALPDDRLPAHGPGRVYYEGQPGDFQLSEFQVWVNGQPWAIRKATASYHGGNGTIDKAIDGDQQTGWSIAGGQGRPHYAIFELAAPLPSGNFEITLLFERYYSSGLGRFRISATTSAHPPAARNASNEIESLLLLPDDRLRPEQRDQLRRHFLATSPKLKREREKIEQLRKQMPAYPTTLVLQERPPQGPRPTFIHHRGEFLQPTERVEPGVLSILPPLPTGAPANRLTFARWLVSPDNPLTARVTVNRHWAAFFGTGIVRTVQDFGYTGEAPSHPELLDWLALEFIREGWSVKRLHRLIVTSATYRAASHGAAQADSRLLAQLPRVRLDAEVIRDSILRASGLLSSKMFGPSVFPPQPATVTTEGAYGALAWNTSPGEDRYRRGLYTFMKRTAPFAMSATFDGPSGEVCLARREISNTPLQALTLLNDVVVVEAAQALGREFAARSDPPTERLESLFRRCLTRRPNDTEKAALLRFLTAQRQRFAENPTQAEKLAGPGDATVERAAWTALARALFNLDEMIVRQ